jgi:hypothetical protein
VNLRRLILLSVSAILVGGSGALAASASFHGGSTSAIAACANAGNGRLRLADTGNRCSPNEHLVTWNVQGPKGDPGPAGPAGPAGAAGIPGPRGQA